MGRFWPSTNSLDSIPGMKKYGTLLAKWIALLNHFEIIFRMYSECVRILLFVLWILLQSAKTFLSVQCNFKVVLSVTFPWFVVEIAIGLVQQIYTLNQNLSISQGTAAVC